MFGRGGVRGNDRLFGNILSALPHSVFQNLVEVGIFVLILLAVEFKAQGSQIAA